VITPIQLKGFDCCIRLSEALRHGIPIVYRGAPSALLIRVRSRRRRGSFRLNRCRSMLNVRGSGYAEISLPSLTSRTARSNC